MDYKHMLCETMLSQSNIDYVMQLVIENYKINNKAISQCKLIITEYIKKLLLALKNYPTNDNELIYAVKYLNEACYNEFIEYLTNKYPNIDIRKNKTKHIEPQKMEILDNLIILNEQEKNDLIASDQKKSILKLLNPITIQLFSNIINSKKKVDVTFDGIYDEEYVNNNFFGVKPDVINQDVNPIIITEVNTNTIIPELDISKGLTVDMLPLVENRISKLVEQKNNYIDEGKLDDINDIDTEKTKLIESVIEYKKTLDKSVKETKNKLNMTIDKKNIDDNIEDLDLQLDPTNDFNDLKNIIIKSKTDCKIVEINLISYYLPSNNNNVTRLNNKFSVFFNGKVSKILIPTMKYEIETLCNYISNQVTFLDIIINEDKTITITNKMNLKFDLLTDDDTVFSILGFTKKASDLKNAVSYTGDKPYNIETNKVFFSLSGTPMEPMEMTFDENITVNKILRKTKNGVSIRQLKLNFMDINEQFYDFIKPFNIRLQITYL